MIQPPSEKALYASREKIAGTASFCSIFPVEHAVMWARPSWSFAKRRAMTVQRSAPSSGSLPLPSTHAAFRLSGAHVAQGQSCMRGANPTSLPCRAVNTERGTPKDLDQGPKIVDAPYRIKNPDKA